MADVDFGGVVKEVCLEYLPDLQVGDYAIVHVGFALQRLDEESALRTLKLFEELGLLQEEFGDPWEAAAAETARSARRVAALSDRAVSRQAGRRTVKYLEEFQDPELATRLLERSTRP